MNTNEIINNFIIPDDLLEHLQDNVQNNVQETHNIIIMPKLNLDSPIWASKKDKYELKKVIKLYKKYIGRSNSPTLKRDRRHNVRLDVNAFL